MVELFKADEGTYSPLYVVFELPYAETVQLPLFEPKPLCGKSNADLTYEVVGGDLPAWITFKEKDRIVEL